MMDTRLASLLLLLLPGALSLSVSLDSLTSRHLRAALETESRLSVYWCKSQVATVLPLSPLLSSPLPSPPLSGRIKLLTASPYWCCHPSISQITNSIIVIVMGVGGVGGAGSLNLWENKEMRRTSQVLPGRENFLP